MYIGLRKNYFDTRDTTRGMDILILLGTSTVVSTTKKRESSYVWRWVSAAREENAPSAHRVSEHVMFRNLRVNERLHNNDPKGAHVHVCLCFLLDKQELGCPVSPRPHSRDRPYICDIRHGKANNIKKSGDFTAERSARCVRPEYRHLTFERGVHEGVMEDDTRLVCANNYRH